MLTVSTGQSDLGDSTCPLYRTVHYRPGSFTTGVATERLMSLERDRASGRSRQGQHQDENPEYRVRLHRLQRAEEAWLVRSADEEGGKRVL